MPRSRPRTPLVALLACAHPRWTLTMTLGLALAAALSGRTGTEVGLVAATALVGQIVLGWLNDVVDRRRDAEQDRPGKPIGAGQVEVGNVTFAIAVAVLVLVPLSVANGTLAGLSYLGFLVVAWIGTAVRPLRASALSPLPWAVSWALLPAFLSYGGYGGGVHGAAPTIAMTVLAALLGVGAHVLLCVGDLVVDKRTGMRHLPLRIALRTGASRLLLLGIAWCVLVGIGIVAAGLSVGLGQEPL